MRVLNSMCQGSEMRKFAGARIWNVLFVRASVESYHLVVGSSITNAIRNNYTRVV